ncbi:hypothetical protein ACFC0C_14125 [Streptomyces sp. NPDC056178]|uniref:hypothetical protein n=1 Tax=Streptomyces sp. NPDC056178 TaxID=3345735 RepID=UPI0035DC99D5
MSTALTTARAPRGSAGRGRVIRRLVPGALLVLLALTGPFLAAHPLDKPITAPFATAGDGAPLGGDQLGRDVLSRLLHGGTALIGSGLLVAAVVTALAASAGRLAVLHPAVGRAVERTADVFILLPPILGIMLVAPAWPAADDGPSSAPPSSWAPLTPSASSPEQPLPSPTPGTSRQPSPAGNPSPTPPLANAIGANS